MNYCTSCHTRLTGPSKPLCKDCCNHFAITLLDLQELLPALHDVAFKVATPHQGERVGHSSPAYAPMPLNASAWEAEQAADGLLEDAMAAVCAGNEHSALPPRSLRPKKDAPTVKKAAFVRLYILTLANACDERTGDAATWLYEFRTLVKGIRWVLGESTSGVTLAGQCPSCGRVIYGHGAVRTACPDCGAHITDTTIAESTLSRIEADDRLGYPTDCSQWLLLMGVKLPAATIRTWAARGRIIRTADGRIPLASLAEPLRLRARH